MFIFHYHQMYHKNVLGELFTASRSESHLNTLRDVSCDMINQGNTKTMRSYGAVFFFYLQNHACGFCKQVCLQLKAIRAAWINNTTKCACNYKWFLNTVFTVSTNSSLFSLRLKQEVLPRRPNTEFLPYKSTIWKPFSLKSFHHLVQRSKYDDMTVLLRRFHLKGQTQGFHVDRLSENA